MTNRYITLRARPEGRPGAANFEMKTEPVPSTPIDGVLRRTIYLSLDPYMRGRMSDAESYATPVSVGHTMVGHTVSQVIASSNPAFAPGDFVAGYDGWQEYAVSNGSTLRKIDPSRAPLTASLGVLGMPGMTAYVGLIDIGQPKSGETVVVSAASGAVGSVVGQIAKIKGCRAVGIAGSPDKCHYVTGTLGFDACVNYKSPSFREDLAAACPDGIDIYFENVGGDVFKAVIKKLNVGARIPVCGLISDYNATEPPKGPNLRFLLVKRATLRGFIVSDHADRQPAFLRDVGTWVADGRVRYREDIVDGLEHAPEALLRLFDGANFGKLLVRVSPDPTSAKHRKP